MGWHENGPDFMRIMKYAGPEVKKAIVERLSSRTISADSSKATSAGAP